MESALQKPYKIIFTPFPDKLHGVIYGVTQERAAVYLIAIDTRRPADMQKMTLKHELTHVLLNHFHQPWRSDEELEAEAIEKAAQMSDSSLQLLLNNALEITHEEAVTV